MGGCTSAPSVNDGDDTASRGKHGAKCKSAKKSQTVPTSTHVSKKVSKRDKKAQRKDTPMPQLYAVGIPAEQSSMPPWYNPAYSVKTTKGHKTRSMPRIFKKNHEEKARCTSRSMLEASAKRVARHKENKCPLQYQTVIAERLRSIEGGLPQRPPQNSKTAAGGIYRGDEVPAAPKRLAECYEQAMEDMNAKWASSDTVRALFANNIVYVAPDKLQHVGKEAVIAKLNEGMQSVLDRIAQASSGMAAGGLTSMGKGAKVKVKGPKKLPDGSTWRMTYTFQMIMMTVTVIDDFTISVDGLILKLARTRK